MAATQARPQAPTAAGPPRGSDAKTAMPIITRTRSGTPRRRMAVARTSRPVADSTSKPEMREGSGGEGDDGDENRKARLVGRVDPPPEQRGGARNHDRQRHEEGAAEAEADEAPRQAPVAAGEERGDGADRVFVETAGARATRTMKIAEATT